MKTIVSIGVSLALAACTYLSWKSQPRETQVAQSRNPLTSISNQPESEISLTSQPEVAKPIGKLGESWKVATRTIHDGDTLRVSNGSEELKIRFCGIDAPELKQPMGQKSRDYLRKIIEKSNNTVYLTKVDTDRYGRTVAEVWRNDGNQAVNVNAEMTRAGWAYYYAQFARNCPDREQIERGEQLAKEKGIGVWSDPRAMRPWDWRRANR